MIFGFLKDNYNEILFNEYGNGDTSTTLRHLVGGNLDYLPLGSIVKKLPKELYSINLVLNKDARVLKICKPNLLVNEDILLGNIVFVKVDNEGNIKGMTDKQKELLPQVMSDLIIPQGLKKVMGCC